ncbi:uncharacterized protein LOC113326957 isoform X2 [Papaver somniferum]|nr:uncharacterized protein LOC113326957 isoform X2 [Papaver somniferum]
MSSNSMQAQLQVVFKKEGLVGNLLGEEDEHHPGYQPNPINPEFNPFPPLPHDPKPQINNDHYQPPNPNNAGAPSASNLKFLRDFYDLSLNPRATSMIWNADGTQLTIFFLTTMVQNYPDIFGKTPQLFKMKLMRREFRYSHHQGRDKIILAHQFFRRGFPNLLSSIQVSNNKRSAPARYGGLVGGLEYGELNPPAAIINNLVGQFNGWEQGLAACRHGLEQLREYHNL